MESRWAFILRWFGPAVVVLGVLLLYRVYLSDWLDDWAFLHQARMQAIQQLQRAVQKPPVP